MVVKLLPVELPEVHLKVALSQKHHLNAALHKAHPHWHRPTSQCPQELVPALNLHVRRIDRVGLRSLSR
jgi:hypothetical protein